MSPRICPDCGASLDACEICDCKEKEDAPATTGTPSSGNDWRHDSAYNLADFLRDVNNPLRFKTTELCGGVMNEHP